MENKSIKKSNLNQLQALVDYMEEYPQFARGCVTFGSSKVSVEEQWKTLVKKLNSIGPPIRSVVEWKKSWGDLKCRTKKSFAENQKSMCDTGGGLYRVTHLTELEQTIDRTLFLSKAAAPSGKLFGFVDRNRSKAVDSIDNCFQALTDTPPRGTKAVAVITPSRQQQNSLQREQSIPQQANYSPKESQPQQQQQQHVPTTIGSSLRNEPREKLPTTAELLQQQQHKRQQNFIDIENDIPTCSSAKKRKTTTDDQIPLIRRQLRVNEQSAAIAKEQANANETLAEATKSLVAVITRMADAVEAQAETSRQNAETQTQILRSIEALTKHLINK